MSISKEAQRILNTRPSLEDLHELGKYEAKVVSNVQAHVAEHGESAETYLLGSQYRNDLEDTIEAAQELRRRTELAEDDNKRQNRILGIE
jgi:hypothetical protein